MHREAISPPVLPASADTTVATLDVMLSIETAATTQVRGGDAKITAVAVGALTNTAVTG